MADVCFDNIFGELKGHVYPGKLRLTSTDFMFRNETTGKVDHIPKDDIATAHWVSRATGICLRVKLKNGTVHRYDGFGDVNSEKVLYHFKKCFGLEITKKEVSFKGFNWGEVEFDGNMLEFTCKNALTFDVPLGNISNASINKNEVIFEFHPNDDAEICLSEMRLYTPGTESDRDGLAASIHANVLQQADIIQVTGDSLVEFKEMQCLQPRGRYDIKLYTNFVHLHGKSFDFKVPKSTIIRLLLLPHNDNRQMFFVAQVDPPLKHGQTRYHFIIMCFEKEKYIDIELSATEDYLKQHYDGKLSQVLAGPEYELIAKLFRVLYNQKLTVPGSFNSNSGGSSVSCSYKASVGLLYPLERGLFFIPRPTVSVRFDEILTVNFSRGTGALRSFDFEVETRNGFIHTFTSIEKDEYHPLYDFITNKRLRVKNIDDKPNEEKQVPEDVWTSSDESHDAYMEKVKTEGRGRSDLLGDRNFAGMNFSDDDEEDKDFKPPESDRSEIAEEYDSNITSSDEDFQDSASGSQSPPQKKKKIVKKPQPTNTSKKIKKNKKIKDGNAPTKPPTAYFIWFNAHRAEIKAELGGSVGVTDIAKAAGERWNNLNAENKSKYQAQALELKEAYMEKMKEYKAKLASGELESPAIIAKKSPKTSKKLAPSTTEADGTFKSAKYVASSESSTFSESENSKNGDEVLDD